MNLDYVTAAYLVFAVVLAWDYLAPRLRLARVRRAIALRQRREAGARP
jgi:heme exporter protein D